MNISKGTIIRTACLVLAIINNTLALFGKSPLPIDNTTLEAVISAVFMFGTAFVAWWENNDFTPEAIAGTELMKELKAKKKAGLE